jgi:hypothetical protein
MRNAPDYGRYAPGPPTAKAIATRDGLAEEMASATSETKRRAVRELLVGHILTEGLPLEEFSTPSGRTFVVRISRPDTEQFTAETTRWLAGRDYVKVVKGLLRDGAGIPPHVADHLDWVVSEKK